MCLQISAMFKVKYGGFIAQERDEPLEELARTLGDVDFCYAVLNKVRCVHLFRLLGHLNIRSLLWRVIS